MKRTIKIIIIFLIIIIGIIIIDTIQAKVLDSSPFIKITENYNKGIVLKKEKGILVYTYVFQNDQKVTVFKWKKYAPPLDEQLDLNKEGNEMETMSITLNKQKYAVALEDNASVQALLKMLPLELTMQELNGNEKYVYLENTLPTDSQDIGNIQKGDVMLYGNNCLVIFYKSFSTSYRYTKIGHITNLPDLGNEDITITIQK